MGNKIKNAKKYYYRDNYNNKLNQNVFKHPREDLSVNRCVP